MQEYIKTDRQLHWLSQLIAKANRTYVPEKKDDSHTNLYYDPLSDRITGRWIESPEAMILFTFNLKTMQFEWLDRQFRLLVSIPALNRSAGDLEKETGDYLKSIGMETENFFRELHFQIPDYKIEKLSDDDISGRGFDHWKYYRDLANQACHSIMGYFQLFTEIRIWPHHFDTGIYLEVNRNLGIGFGLAMKDEMVGQPYFYIAGYSGEDPLIYDHLPALPSGNWITGSQWKGAVLPLSDVPFPDSDQANKTLRQFILKTSLWYSAQ